MSDSGGSDTECTLPAIVDDLGDAVIVRDAESGATVAVNDAVEAIFGYSPETFRGLDPAVYAADPERAADARTAARGAAAETGSATYLWEAERADGSTFWAESTVSTTTVDGRDCLACVVRDVTDRVERERELERFGEVLSHDLRSPLNAAQAQVDILRSTVEGGEEFLNRLDRVHDRMAAIVDDVRTLVDEGGRVTELTRVDLNDLVTAAWEAVGGDDAGARHHYRGRDRTEAEAKLVVDDNLGTVTADEGRLQRLFENLFENAIRHGSADGADVTVTVSALPEGVVVADDGPGIGAADPDRIFEYGYTTADGGTGFGLNIVAAAAEAHGWDVTVGESDAGGARFEITGMEPEPRTDSSRETPNSGVESRDNDRDAAQGSEDDSADRQADDRDADSRTDGSGGQRRGRGRNDAEVTETHSFGG
jgi:PAS domain S-box-containing protein